MPLTKLQKEKLRGRASQLSKLIRALSDDRLVKDGIKNIDEHTESGQGDTGLGQGHGGPSQEHLGVVEEYTALIEEYTEVIDQLLASGFEGDNPEDILQVVSVHSEMISALSTISERLSAQQREGLLKMRGILRYLDSLPASISVSSSKKG